MELQNTLLIAIVIVLLTLWYINRRKRYRVFKDLGIPGPEPHILLGNLREINEKTLPEALKAWRQKYGKQFGYYLGSVPFFVTMDTEVLKQIQIKDFHSFINRPLLVSGGIVADDKFNHHVISERNDRWKQQRAILTPTFTSGKMKQMLPHMEKAVDILMNKMEKKRIEDEGFDIYEMYKGLTLDVISRTAFGTETNVQNNPDDPFLLGVKELLKEGPVSGIVLISMCFPEIKHLLRPIRTLKEKLKYLLAISHVRVMMNQCVDMVRWRRSDPKNRRDDLLQLMLDAEISTDMSLVSADNLTAGYETESKVSKANELKNDNTKKVKSSFWLNEIEVASNTVILVFAGYETTSTALAYTSHVLVNNPDIQEKIRKEILDVQAEHGGLDYIALSKLKYLDMVLSETLRYYPPVTTFITRTAKKDVKYGDLTIPKGTATLVPVELLHRDPEHWSEPDKFIPERFSPENRGQINQMAYQPFGAGPRNCIGMRFAQMEAKLALAKILCQYRLVPYSKTEIGDIEPLFKVAITTPKNGVHVKVEKI